MPGLVDTHIHAAQYANAGLGLDRGLLEWLEVYTYPEEARYQDTAYAKQVYEKVVVRGEKNTNRYIIQSGSEIVIGLLVKQFNNILFIDFYFYVFLGLEYVAYHI